MHAKISKEQFPFRSLAQWAPTAFLGQNQLVLRARQSYVVIGKKVRRFSS